MNFKDTLIGGAIDSVFNKTDKKEIETAVSQMVNAIKTQRSMFRKEIREWKMARFQAMNSEMPRRKLLIDLYEDIMTDAFIWGRADTRKLRISNKGFAIVNNAGEIDEDKTKLLRKSWFNQFIKYAVESVYYGYSLVYPKELDDNGLIKRIALVHRDHIVPETCQILTNPYDSDGVDFTEAPYDRWMVFINHDHFLGLLDKAAPLWIFKKHSWQNWDEFEELFGIPIRTATVASTDKRVLAEVDKWLRELGSAAYGRFPEGVELDIKESKSRDSFNVFNEKRKACNEELATLIDGHFETAKDTGSRAKAGSIIESTQALIQLDDETRVEFCINDELMPILRGLGYPFAEDDVFIWNENEQSTPKERLEIFKGVKLLGYKVKKEQIESELDVEIDAEVDDDPPPSEPPKKDKPKNKKEDFNLPHDHKGCGAHLESYRELNLNIVAKLSPEEEKLLQQIFDDPDSIDWSYSSFKASHGKLLEGLRKGIGNVDFDFDSEDHLTMRHMRANIHRFGADKTTKEIFDLNQIIKDPAVDTFSEFRGRVKTLFPNYRESWLRTEYEQALATSQAATRYNEMMEDIEDAPFWRYVTVGDDRVRQSHQALNEKIFRKDDAQSWKFLPPNGYKCRCDAEDVLEGYDGEVSNFSDAVNADIDGYEQMQKSGHDVNWGDAKQVFTSRQSYLNGLEGNKKELSFLDYKTGDLPDVADILNKPNLPGTKLRFESFTDRSGKASLTDVNGLPIWVDKNVFDRDPRVRNAIPEVLANPDEVYFNELGRGFLDTYIKHYDEGSVALEVISYKKEFAKIATAELNKNPDAIREGLLIFNKSEFVNDRFVKYLAYNKDFTKVTFDTSNGGYIVRHKLHGQSELKDNLYTSEKLKNIGKTVELLPIEKYAKSADALINDVEWEFKLLTDYKNLFNTVKREINSASKQSGNVLLHINNLYSKKDLIRGLNAAIKNDSKKRVEFVGLLFNDGKFYVFSRKQIETREFEKILNN